MPPKRPAEDPLQAPRSRTGLTSEQTRRNQELEAEQMRVWVAKEDDFVLQQARKKAAIRVREDRAKTIDWLVVTLSALEQVKDEDELESDDDLDVLDPVSIFDDLDANQLEQLGRDIDAFGKLEKNARALSYWSALSLVCKDRYSRLRQQQPQGRSNAAVMSDVDKLLAPKSLAQLETLEAQIRSKLESDEAIDADYWTQLLQNVGIYKAKAELHAFYQAVIAKQLQTFKDENRAAAAGWKTRLEILLGAEAKVKPLVYQDWFEVEPALKVRPEDKDLELLDENEFLKQVKTARDKIRAGFLPPPKHKQETSDRPAAAGESNLTNLMYEREAARGINDDEDYFPGEEEVATKAQPGWSGKYRPRKPRYFNRVHMGFEWNKYNQTHYDPENPPPKIVQGYKFNIFYPDLIDKTRAPTYKIEREGGRRKGESHATAGEVDTCLIRFISGPPYEDVAFRILDKEWDYGSRHERGFRSTFDKGILQLHFVFKRIYYRK